MTGQDERDQWLTQDDAALLADCKVDTFRSSGPGGQHANKISSAVRLRHQPSGQMVVAEEERSQHANKKRAVKRLRLAIALNVRQPVSVSWTPPTVFRQYLSKMGRLDVSVRNRVYPAIVAAVLDAVAACEGRIREAGKLLGLSTGQLSRFVVRDGKMLAVVNHIRRETGLRMLSPR